MEKSDAAFSFSDEVIHKIFVIFAALNSHNAIQKNLT